MIVIYAILTSVIVGSKSNKKVLGQIQYACSKCGRSAYHTIVRSNRWFTLYFLPIVPIGKTTTARCNLCGFQQSIDNKQADAWLQQAQPNVPRVPQKKLKP